MIHSGYKARLALKEGLGVRLHSSRVLENFNMKYILLLPHFLTLNPACVPARPNYTCRSLSLLSEVVHLIVIGFKLSLSYS